MAKAAILIIIGLAAIFVAAGVGLSLWTARGVADIERRYPPSGSFAEIDGVRIHYVDQPSGGTRLGPPLPPVIFVHGASSNLSDASSVFAGRLDGERRLIFLDRPGHGWSARGPEDGPEPARQAAIVVGLMDRLGIERAVVVGHSWGGAVVAALGTLYPERAAGLVFVSPATHPWPGGVAWYYSLAALPVIGPAFAATLPYPVMHDSLGTAAATSFAPEPMPATYPEAARLALLLRPDEFVANARDVEGLNAAVTALAPRYAEITAPTVVITGDADSVVRPDIHSAGLIRAIAGAELVELAGVGHMPHQTHPEVVIQAIDRVTRRFLAAHPELWQGVPGEM